MKIKHLTTSNGPVGPFVEGDVQEFPAHLATAYIESGAAVKAPKGAALSPKRDKKTFMDKKGKE